MQPITREQVERRLAADDRVVLIEALAEPNFRKYHLPGAINIPVKDEEFETKAGRAIPDKDTPIIVYCQDQQCQASPTAAKRLEALGYREVYDYEGGKDDWTAAGNRVES